MRFFKRQYFRRFLRPVNRLRLSPSVVGRTAVVGLAFGLTASVGVQVIGVVLVWLIARTIRRPINLLIAIVLTAVTNPLTIPPIYTLYFFTGCALLQCDAAAITVEPLIAAIDTIHWQGILNGSWDSVLSEIGELGASSWQVFVIPLAVTALGSLPFAIAGSAAGYYFGRYVGHRLHIRRVRRAAQLARQAQAG